MSTEAQARVPPLDLDAWINAPMPQEEEASYRNYPCP